MALDPSARPLITVTLGSESITMSRPSTYEVLVHGARRWIASSGSGGGAAAQVAVDELLVRDRFGDMTLRPVNPWEWDRVGADAGCAGHAGRNPNGAAELVIRRVGPYELPASRRVKSSPTPPSGSLPRERVKITFVACQGQVFPVFDQRLADQVPLRDYAALLERRHRHACRPGDHEYVCPELARGPIPESMSFDALLALAERAVPEVMPRIRQVPVGSSRGGRGGNGDDDPGPTGRAAMPARTTPPSPDMMMPMAPVMGYIPVRLMHAPGGGVLAPCAYCSGAQCECGFQAGGWSG